MRRIGEELAPEEDMGVGEGLWPKLSDRAGLVKVCKEGSFWCGLGLSAIEKGEEAAEDGLDTTAA